MTTTIRREDIGFTYQQPAGLYLYAPRSWEARLHGRLSTGEAVDIAQAGVTADEALLLLELLIKSSGWEIEGGWTPLPSEPRKTPEQMWAEMNKLRAKIERLRGQTT